MTMDATILAVIGLFRHLAGAPADAGPAGATPAG
jgi:hypothetical protein